MTEDRLAEIEARVAAATQGPWEAEATYEGEGYYGLAVVTPNDCSERGPMAVLDHASRLNATFIAHARQDVPDLVAEVRRLREVIKQAEWMCGPCGSNGHRHVCPWCDGADYYLPGQRHRKDCPAFTEHGAVR